MKNTNKTVQKKYSIASIFGPTIQGEGSMVGTPCIFLRFAGCNMWNGDPETRNKSDCSFCDTDFRVTAQYHLKELIDELRKHLSTEYVRSEDAASVDYKPCVDWIVISGGEPMLQVDPLLLHMIHTELRVKIAVETNGTIAIPEDTYGLLDHVTMSPKVPPNKLKQFVCTDLKVLYPHHHDAMAPYDFEIVVFAKNFYIQPIDDCGFGGKKTKGTSIKQCLAYVFKRPHWRISVQLHKLLGLE